MNYICNHNWCLIFIAEQLGKASFLRHKAKVNVKYGVALNLKDIEENSMNYLKKFFKNFCYFWNKQEIMVKCLPECVIFAGKL